MSGPFFCLCTKTDLQIIRRVFVPRLLSALETHENPKARRYTRVSWLLAISILGFATCHFASGTRRRHEAIATADVPIRPSLATTVTPGPGSLSPAERWDRRKYTTRKGNNTGGLRKTKSTLARLGNYPFRQFARVVPGPGHDKRTTKGMTTTLGRTFVSIWLRAKGMFIRDELAVRHWASTWTVWALCGK